MDRARMTTPTEPLSVRLSRRAALQTSGAGLTAMLLGAGATRGGRAAQDATPSPTSGTPVGSPAATPASGPAATIVAIAREAMEQQDLKAVILRVTIDGREVVTAALGESMTGVPATVDMHFRNGAVAISYMATALLVLVDRGVVGLDDPIARWLPDLPDADQVTLRMLANMTSGYNDFVANEGFVAAFLADPFRQWAAEERIAIGLSTPRLFAPGTNWNYAHTNYVILGRALEQATGRPLAALLRELVLDPLGLRNTQSWATPAIPEPVLHAFSSERRQALGIPAGTRFYEESTYWNPSWTLAEGAIQTTNIYDMTATAIAVGEGTLLAPESHAAQVEPRLVGFGAPLQGCAACATLTEAYGYGLGVVLNGPWIAQTPLFAGLDSVEAYLPAAKLAIAVAATFGERAFDEQGNLRAPGPGHAIAARIGAELAPGFPLPTRG